MIDPIFNLEKIFKRYSVSGPSLYEDLIGNENNSWVGAFSIVFQRIALAGEASVTLDPNS